MRRALASTIPISALIARARIPQLQGEIVDRAVDGYDAISVRASRAMAVAMAACATASSA